MTFILKSYPVARVLALVPFLVLASGASAASRRVVLASGDCKDAALGGQSKALHDLLRTRPGEELLTSQELLERLFPAPSGSLEDIQRQFEAARGQFYEAHHARAAQGLGEVLAQVERLPVGEARWKLSVDAWLLQGMTLRALGRVKESDDAFRNVLRLDAQHQLDPDYYTPSTRQSFDKLRRELDRAHKVRLSVKSTLPSSEVFLDGRGVGQTPLVLEVPPGSYALTLQKEDAVSFPRQLAVQGEELPVLVDLAYEGSLSALPFPCLASTDEAERSLSYAVRLGGALGVEEVIVVRLEGTTPGSKWLAATVLNVEGGQRLREGGFKIRGLEAPPESLSALVDFITTGKAPPSLVVATRPDLQPPWEQPVVSTGVSEAPRAASGPSALRVASYVTLGAGVAALAVAGGVRLAAQQDWTRLQPHLNESGRIEADDLTGRQLVGQLARKGQLLNGLLIGSGAALVTGTVFFLTSSREQSAVAPVSVGVSADAEGAEATLSGTF